MAKVTLEQWRMFQAVVEHGGFSQAAEAVHKSQSSINHAVHKLQESLGVALLEVRGRKAELTDAGRILLARAGSLLSEAEALETVAASLAEGVEAVLTLAVDVIFDYECLLGAVERFAAEFPHTRLEVRETVLSGAEELLLQQRADFILSARVPQGFVGEPVARVRFLPVAHPEHPLHQLGRPVQREDLKACRQIVLRDSAIKNPQDDGWLGSDQRITVTNVQTSIDLIERGLGFAWLPETRIRESLSSDRLLPLPTEESWERDVTVYLVYADADRCGPAAAFLIDALRSGLGPLE
ncbi:LysR family transcriptional regulator [Microbulbifer thermotolerans]|uniref:LysR family transcriptional regulator n=1 Tax=Microbulbifer thermotolerans TaxID=252514 RepID=A0A143HS41_MICTH|nr:LysR family transcriptional regulator [Microbulbifer thermotolerans]AMX04316.1 LysR family transcriptional regulator [Microbulbifer thermotolerans]MCX2778575.1 LysR family transcriptional regulator [Microbulbifer thermotolerans]MCX2782878.1 LysR family transcriptional regulator [Microbulbifer thermotolerans]MCX2794051.1 LysR family transcriptional regulator [Microbulbifer thermotolerans]MCX2801760.1 LysR family transcriptional regulator [Microbulbifer thermotolerans]